MGDSLRLLHEVSEELGCNRPPLLWHGHLSCRDALVTPRKVPCAELQHKRTAKWLKHSCKCLAWVSPPPPAGRLMPMVHRCCQHRAVTIERATDTPQQSPQTKRRSAKRGHEAIISYLTARKPKQLGETIIFRVVWALKKGRNNYFKRKPHDILNIQGNVRHASLLLSDSA